MANKKLVPLEKDIQKAILEYLQLLRIFAWRNNTGAMSGEHHGKKWFMRFGFPGIADILGILPSGRFLAIEVKRPGGKLTLDQVAFKQAVESNGGMYLLAQSIDDVKKAFE